MNDIFVWIFVNEHTSWNVTIKSLYNKKEVLQTNIIKIAWNTRLYVTVILC